MPSPKAVERIAIVTHNHEARIAEAVARVERLAEAKGVQVSSDDRGADLAVTLGGDGSMLRAFHRFLGTGVPVIGVNFGRVGFLTSIEPDRLEADLARVFAGDYRVVELPTVVTEADGLRAVAVNDVVGASSHLGRMVELQWTVGGEDLGRIRCDGVICATPSGSTAYNLSNGGPVLVRGVDAMVATFVAPHSLHVRPLVIPRGVDVVVRNRTPDLAVTLLVDGMKTADVPPGSRFTVRLGPARSLLATLPDTTFFSRYRATFTE